MSDDGRILHEALVSRGLTFTQATTILERFVDTEVSKAEVEIGLGILTEAVEKLILEHTDTDREWDGDDAAETIQARFLEWLPDMIAHANANKIREWVAGRPQNDYARKAAATRMAEMIDPFRLCYLDSCDQAPHWVRRSDGEDVPHGALQGDEGNEE
jgi:hypothetical protein